MHITRRVDFMLPKKRYIFFVIGPLLVMSSALSAAELRSTRCATQLSHCPSRGCTAADTPEAFLNEMKRRVPSGGAAVRLTFDDFAELQDQATELVDQNIPVPDRDVLRNLSLKSQSREVAEGDLVEIIGFISGQPTRTKPSGSESVNCRIIPDNGSR